MLEISEKISANSTLISNLIFVIGKCENATPVSIAQHTGMTLSQSNHELKCVIAKSITDLKKALTEQIKLSNELLNEVS